MNDPENRALIDPGSTPNRPLVKNADIVTLLISLRRLGHSLDVANIRPTPSDPTPSTIVITKIPKNRGKFPLFFGILVITIVDGVGSDGVGLIFATSPFDSELCCYIFWGPTVCSGRSSQLDRPIFGQN